ncbi:hypothetical protein ABPG72_010034 [Tetrahymena utriculariae]
MIKIAFQIFRLCFYCFAFVVFYFSIKYLLLNCEINTGIAFQNNIGLVIYQFSFWILTIIAEQISSLIFYSDINVKNFQYFKQRIKIFTIIYILVPLALGFYLVILYFGNQMNIDDAFQGDENSGKIEKVVSIMEFSLSTILLINLVSTYRQLSYRHNNQHNQPLMS